jgi:uncharacterized protein (DUF1697 family)
MPFAVRIALLRAIGGATHAKLTMKALEAQLIASGLPRTQSLLATGNFVIASDWTSAAIRTTIANLLSQAGLEPERAQSVLIRDADALERLIPANPFPEAARQMPSQVQVVFLSSRPEESALATLRSRALGVERIERIGDEIAIDYASLISQSKLTTTLIEKTLDCRATARNWNTVLRLGQTARQIGQW